MKTIAQNKLPAVYRTFILMGLLATLTTLAAGCDNSGGTEASRLHGRAAGASAGLWEVEDPSVPPVPKIPVKYALMREGKRFIVFDCLLFEGKPDLRPWGFTPLACPDRNFYRLDPTKPNGEDPSMPERARLVEVMKKIAGDGYGWCALDVETWPVTGDESEVNRSIRKFSTLADWVREVTPEMKIGYYSVLPVRDYYASLGVGDVQRWKEDNRRLASIARHVNAIFPSLYTFYDDPDDWRKSAEAAIREARVYGKPVYPFLCPQYHDSNKELGGTLMPGADWRQQLETCFAKADGVVLWGGWGDLKGNRCPWNIRAAWWRQTIDFLNQKSQP